MRPRAAGDEGTDQGDLRSASPFAILNGASATMAIFAGASLSCFLGALFLPRSVDGPRRAALLPGGLSTRSDAQAHDARKGLDA